MLVKLHIVSDANDDPFISVTSDGKRTISDTVGLDSKQEVVVQRSGTTAKMLNKYAADSFKQMKEAARRDGIDLTIGSADKSKSAADTCCADANNAWVVARFPNSHNWGLAVDFYLSKGTLKFCEACTGIMQNVRFRSTFFAGIPQ